MFTLAISCLTTSSITLIHGPNIPGSYVILFFIASNFTLTITHIHNWVWFLLWLNLLILSGSTSPLFSSTVLDTYWPGEFIFQCPISYGSWGSQGKNSEVVCHSLLQWATFLQNSPPWPTHLGWPYTAWLIASLSYTRLWSMWSFWRAFCDCA